MYLKTPKRYRAGYKERRRVINLKWLWLWILTPIVIYGGIQIYENRHVITPPIEQFIQQRVADAQSGVATLNAPTPMPTENPTDRLIRADNAWQRGAIGRAIEEYTNAAPSVPNNVEVFNRMALGHLMEGRNDDSLAVAEQAITADPYSSDAWAIRAAALARTGEPERGVASARQALALRPNSALALAFLGEAYRIAGQTSLALESAEQAIETDPNYYAGYFVRAMINYYSAGQWESAREDFRIAHDLAPTLPYIVTEMAWLEWRYENTDLSMEMLNEVLELDPNNLDALYAVGYFHYQYYGNPEQSLEYLRRCVTADPENAFCLDYLGIVQTVTGDFQSALAAYQQLIDSGTQVASYYLRAGNAYINVGDCNGALPVLRAGYQIEQSAETPNVDRIAAFESYLAECQPGFVPPTQPTLIPDSEITAEAGA